MELTKLFLVATGIAAPWLLTPVARAESTLTTLVVFNGTNGAKPDGLLLARDGSFYGTTCLGGVDDIGTIFRMTSDGRLTTLASFDGRNGKWPCGELVQGSDGSFYGTAGQGGGQERRRGCLQNDARRQAYRLVFIL